MNQIQHYTGQPVHVLCRDGSLITGRLAFYNWDAQVLHLADYTIKLAESKKINTEESTKASLPLEGEFIILNKSDWVNLAVKG